MPVVWFFIQTLAGIAIGLVVFYGMVFAAAWAYGRFKICNFPILPFVLIPCCPLGFSLLRDVLAWKRAFAALSPRASPGWLARKPVSLGMALSTLHLTGAGTGLIFALIALF